MKYAKKVGLYTKDGRLIRWVHAEEAKRKVLAGEARRVNRRRVEIERPAGGAVGPPRVLGLADYMGKALTRVEHPAGRPLTQFVEMDVRDRWAYALSVTECLVGA